MTIRVALADDHVILRQGLRALLEREQDITVVAEAADGYEAVRIAREFSPDVIVMDMTMPNLDGIKASQQILEENPAIRIIMLTMVLDRTCVAQTLKTGITGYVLKDCASDELVTAIRTTVAGFPYLCRKITGIVVNDYARIIDDSPASLFTILSTREQEVLKLIADGKTTKEIAFQFGVSIKTIDSRRNNIMAKLKVNSVADLIKCAIREGLSDLGGYR